MALIASIDFAQAKTLAKFSLKSEWRTSSMRYSKGKRKSSFWWFFFSVFSYLIIGLMLVPLYKNNTEPYSALAVTAIVMMYVMLIAASNIFLAFGTGFLSPNETDVLSPFPITSETFYFSRLLIIAVYTLLPTLLIATPSAVMASLRGGSPYILAFAATIFSAALAAITSAMAVIFFYSLIIKVVVRRQMMRIIGYAQFGASFIVTLSFVFLPRVVWHAKLDDYTLATQPLLKLFPAYWFASFPELTLGNHLPDIGLLAIAALVSFFFFVTASHLLLAKSYRIAVEDLAQSSVEETKRMGGNAGSERSIFASIFLRSHESKAVWRIFRSQFRFDSKFRLGLFSWLPITAIYFLIAVSEGSIRDPFAVNVKEIVQANFLYLIAMLSPLLIMQQIAQSESYKASWIFFAVPIDRARLVLGARNIVQILIFIPYLAALTVALCFYMPIASAVMHMLMLGGIAQLILELQMLFVPKIPFSEQRKQQKNTVSRFVLIFALMIVPLALLFTIVHFCYHDPVRYWAALAFVLTLALVFDQFVRRNLQKRLELVEYAG